MAFSLKKILKNRNIFIDILALLFGIGAWVAVNGLWVELPILVEQLPEQWSLPSYMTIVIQTANIGAILYGVFHKLWPKKVNETTTTIVIMTIGTTATLLLVYFWDETLVVGGELHSMGLLILVFFVSVVDCTSSVVFIPFMALFSETYLVSYFVGEGFSGFFPSIVALAQGVGGNPSCVNVSVVNVTTNETEYEIHQVTPEPGFSVEVFFYVLFAMMCVSFIAFLTLRLYPWAQSCYASPKLITPSTKTLSQTKEASSDYKELTCSYHSVTERSLSYQAENNTLNLSNLTRSSGNSNSITNTNSKLKDIGFHLVILTWINFLLNGVLMSIQSYSCLPYGNLAYHLATSLSNAANPIACSIAFFIPNYNKSMIVIMTVLSSLIGVYILTLAILSPFPPLVGTTTGETLVVLAWIIIIGLISHTKTSIAMLLHEKGSNALFWYGSATQFGSFVGSLLMFLLVNVFKLFKSYYPC